MKAVLVCKLFNESTFALSQSLMPTFVLANERSVKTRQELCQRFTVSYRADKGPLRWLGGHEQDVVFRPLDIFQHSVNLVDLHAID